LITYQRIEGAGKAALSHILPEAAGLEYCHFVGYYLFNSLCINILYLSGRGRFKRRFLL